MSQIRTDVGLVVEEARLAYEKKTGTEITTGTADYLYDIIEDIVDEYGEYKQLTEPECLEIYDRVLSEIEGSEQRNR